MRMGVSGATLRDGNAGGSQSDPRRQRAGYGERIDEEEPALAADQQAPQVLGRAYRGLLADDRDAQRRRRVRRLLHRGQVLPADAATDLEGLAQQGGAHDRQVNRARLEPVPEIGVCATGDRERLRDPRVRTQSDQCPLHRPQPLFCVLICQDRNPQMVRRPCLVRRDSASEGGEQDPERQGSRLSPKVQGRGRFGDRHG